MRLNISRLPARYLHALQDQFALIPQPPQTPAASAACESCCSHASGTWTSRDRAAQGCSSPGDGRAPSGPCATAAATWLCWRRPEPHFQATRNRVATARRIRALHCTPAMHCCLWIQCCMHPEFLGSAAAGLVARAASPAPHALCFGQRTGAGGALHSLSVVVLACAGVACKRSSTWSPSATGSAAVHVRVARDWGAPPALPAFKFSRAGC